MNIKYCFHLNYYGEGHDVGQVRSGKHTIQNCPVIEELDYEYDDDDIEEQIKALKAFEAKKIKPLRMRNVNTNVAMNTSPERHPSINQDKKRRNISKVAPSSDDGKPTDGRPRYKKAKGEVTHHQEKQK